MDAQIETLDIPILYSFRRCPYAMRARMALAVSGCVHAHREVVLRDKPVEMVTASAKATVPVLVLADGTVIDESLAIMDKVLVHNDPQTWLAPETGTLSGVRALIAENDGVFKHHLDRYKYAVRYEDADPVHHRGEGLKFLQDLNGRLANHSFLFGNLPCLADFAIFPFVRQFANTDRAWFDAQDLAPLQNWLDGHLNSDLFTGIMKKWPQWHAGDEELLRPAS